MAPQSRGRKSKFIRTPAFHSPSPTISNSYLSPHSPLVSPTTATSTFNTPAAPQPTSPRQHSLLSNDVSSFISPSASSDEADFQSHYSPNYASSESPSSASESDNPPSTSPAPSQLRRPASLPYNASNSSFHLSPFAPPFYNRPPTPLPPSPSLTSLFRPSFSTQNSRPTTPSSSDIEGHTGTHSSDPTTAAASNLTKSARTATTVPRASPKVPTYEYYGFVLYLVSSLAFLIYLLWSYLPSPFLHQLGIRYYPNRWWSLAIPSFLVMSIVYIYVALASYNTGYLTLEMDSIENLVDEAANIAALDRVGRIRGSMAASYAGNRSEPGMLMMNPSKTSGGGRSHIERKGWREVWSEGTDAVMDVPIGGVCEILYGNGREPDSDDEEETWRDQVVDFKS